MISATGSITNPTTETDYLPQMEERKKKPNLLQVVITLGSLFFRNVALCRLVVSC